MFQSVLHFPIWQGAGGRYGYGRGAGVLRSIAAKHLPVVDVAVDDNDFSPLRDKVLAFDTLLRHFAKAEAALAHMPMPRLVLGGDCVSDYMSIAAALERFGSRMALLWIDAHPDINTPASSPSNNFHGMLVRSLMGEGPDAFTRLAPTKRLRSSCSMSASVKPIWMKKNSASLSRTRIFSSSALPTLKVAALRRCWMNCAPVVSLISMSILIRMCWITDYPQAVVAVPGGLSAATSVRLLQLLRADFPLAGAALTEYSLEQSAGAAETELGRQSLEDGFGLLFPFLLRDNRTARCNQMLHGGMN